jgi:molybdopterin converting factor subunit 1
MLIKILYFARLREVFGLEAESLQMPAQARVFDLLEVLRTRGGVWSGELAPGRAFRVAVNQDLADAQTPLSEAAEVAIFPPVTGG